VSTVPYRPSVNPREEPDTEAEAEAEVPPPSIHPCPAPSAAAHSLSPLPAADWAWKVPLLRDVPADASTPGHPSLPHAASPSPNPDHVHFADSSSSSGPPPPTSSSAPPPASSQALPRVYTALVDAGLLPAALPFPPLEAALLDAPVFTSMHSDAADSAPLPSPSASPLSALARHRAREGYVCQWRAHGLLDRGVGTRYVCC
jgi:hypothetical protein